MIDVKGLSKSFGDHLVLDNIDQHISPGEKVVVIGPSGSGKSTILKLITAEIAPTGGRLMVNGYNLNNIRPRQVPYMRRTLGVIFQDFRLIEKKTVRENLTFAMRAVGASPREIRKRVPYVLELVGLDQKGDRKPNQLSGGEQQRVAIARALVKRPDILLLDEPLSNLDARLRLEMREEIRRIQTETGVTTVFVTHDQEEAMSITDEIVLMRTGVVQQQCPPQQMYLNPANRFVAGFLGNPPINFFRLDVCGGTVCLAEDYMLRVHGAADGPVLVGIRPEAWRLGQGLRTAAEAVEMRGKDLLVTFSLAGERARAILDITAGVAAGDAVELTLEPRLVYFFDPETGARLDAEVAG